jgi:hypothetical protein
MTHEVGITHLRDMLGVAGEHVARSDEPLIVRRYRRTDVVPVPLWEWPFLKRMEQAIRAGDIDVLPMLRGLGEFGETWLDDVPESG